MRFHQVNRRLSLAPFPCGTVFFLNGFGLANWVTRIPDIQHKTAFPGAELGFSLLFIALGSLIGIPLAGRLIGHYGSRTDALGFWRGAKSPNFMIQLVTSCGHHGQN
jgi:MFS family permease